MENFPQEPNQSQPPTGGVPPPPQPEVTLRTQESDLQSLQSSGGLTPQAEPVLTQPAETSASFSAETQKTEAEVLSSGAEAGQTEPTMEAAGGSRRWLWIIILIILAAGVTGGIYYSFRPLTSDFSENSGTSAETGSQAPTAPPPASPLPAAGLIHQSAFGIPTENTAQILPTATALKIEGNKKLPPGDLKEVSVLDNGRQVPFADFLNVLIPGAAASPFTAVLRENFEEDFTAFLYYDENGAWPGFVLRLKADTATDLMSLRAKLASLEGLDLSGFYLSPAGQPGMFKSSQVNSQPTRYLTFSMTGAAFNYGVLSRYLIISTSYNGFLSALQFLNF